MGQELAVQLSAADADLALCDISEAGMAETVAKCASGRRVILHAPHVKCSVVMPGHISTGIALNSALVQGAEASPAVTEWTNIFRNNAPTSSGQAAAVILDGVKAGQWRILVADDARVTDTKL